MLKIIDLNRNTFFIFSIKIHCSLHLLLGKSTLKKIKWNIAIVINSYSNRNRCNTYIKYEALLKLNKKNYELKYITSFIYFIKLSGKNVKPETF